MTYPQQPGGWNDPSAPAQQPPAYPDPNQQFGGHPAGYPDPHQQFGGQPAAPGVAPGAAYPGYGYPGYGHPGYGHPGYGHPGMVPAPPTNGMAIASLAVSVVGVLGLCGYGIGGFIGAVGAILGHVAVRQIRERGENGAGLARAGIIIGWISTGIAVLATLAIVALIIFAASQSTSTV
jgi:hypothetical protein